MGSLIAFGPLRLTAVRTWRCALGLWHSKSPQQGTRAAEAVGGSWANLQNTQTVAGILIPSSNQRWQWKMPELNRILDGTSSIKKTIKRKLFDDWHVCLPRVTIWLYLIKQEIKRIVTVATNGSCVDVHYARWTCYTKHSWKCILILQKQKLLRAGYADSPHGPPILESALQCATQYSSFHLTLSFHVHLDTLG